MKRETLVELKSPEIVAEDPLMEILREGAQKLLKLALKAEINSSVEK